MKTNQRKKKKQSVQPSPREKIFNGWKNSFVLWFQSQLRHNLIATGLLLKSFISDRGLKIRNNVKSDISDEIFKIVMVGHHYILPPIGCNQRIQEMF